MRRAFLIVLLSAFAATAQPLPSYKDLKYPPLPQVHVPEPAAFTLSNGMRVFLLEDHELPLIHGLALIRTGNLFDPPEKRGLSEITAAVLRSGGTKAKTGDQIDEQLENMAASVESAMDETSASMTFSGLRESTDSVLSVFKEVLTDPQFRQDKIDLTISQTRSAISRRNDEPNVIAERELLSVLYGRDTPYGWQIEYEHLARIHRDDLVQFYRRYYFPKNILLAVYGDFSTAEMKNKLESLFAGWTVEQPSVPPFPAVTAKPAPGVYLAEKPDVTQTFFAIGELGGTRQGLSGAAGGGEYPGSGIQQPARLADPDQAGVCLRHRRGMGGQLQSSGDVPNHRKHEIGFHHGSAASDPRGGREAAHFRGDRAGTRYGETGGA